MTLPDGSMIEYQTIYNNKTKVYLTTSAGESKLSTEISENLQIAYFENERKLVISDSTHLYFFE
jgi:hypothetical protein